MKKVALSSGERKSETRRRRQAANKRRKSNAEAVGVTAHGDPGVRDGSPHGLNARQWISLRSSRSGPGWDVVLCEMGELPLCTTRTVLVCDVSLHEAEHEAELWSEGTGVVCLWTPGLPRMGSEGVTNDPSAGWPL